MASFVYNSAKKAIIDGSIDLLNDSLKIMLLDSDHVPDATDTEKADVVADEISGTGYTAGGAALSNVSLTRSGAVVTFDADDVVIDDLSPDFRYAVIYDDTHADDALIALLDPGALQEPGGLDAKLKFNASGIFTLTDA